MFPPKYHQNGGIFNVFVRLQEYHANTCMSQGLSKWLVGDRDIQVELSRQSPHFILYPLQVSHEIHTFNCFHLGTTENSPFFIHFWAESFSQPLFFAASLLFFGEPSKDSYDLLRSEAVFLSPESRCPTWNEAVRRYVDVKRCLSSWRLGAVNTCFFVQLILFFQKKTWMVLVDLIN